MEPDKPPVEELKPERIQDRILGDGEPSFIAGFVAVLDRIESVARGLRGLFSRSDNDN